MTESEDLRIFGLGCILATRLEIPDADSWLRAAEARLLNGEQKMRPEHPLAAEEGKSTDSMSLDTLHELLGEQALAAEDPRSTPDV